MVRKRALLERYDAICTDLVKGSNRLLTPKEEQEAMCLLHKQVYGEDDNPTAEEVQALWDELLAEAPHILDKANNDHNALLEEIRKAKLLH